MKKLLLFLFFILSVFTVKAQKADAPDLDKIEIKEPVGITVDTKNIFTAVEIGPSFRGGMDNFYRYLSYNIHYPPEAVKNRSQGKVFVTFVVERDGSLTNVKILRGVSHDIDAEAVRVVSGSPKWSPGIQNGRPIRVQFSLAINFKLPSPVPVVSTQQTDTIPHDPNKTFTAVETAPKFPGGIDRFYEFLMKNLRYPAVAREKNIQGKVFVTFVVERDGSLTDIKVVKSLTTETDAEALRLIKSSPKWDPGIQNGSPVRVQYTMPINFNLSDQ